MLLKCILIWTMCIALVSMETIEDYLDRRYDILLNENKTHTGSSISLTSKEKKVNELLTFLKHKEIKQGLETGNYPTSLHLFHAKKDIEKSDVFKIIKILPKGAALHVHDMAMVDMNWVIQKITYSPNLYTCHNASGQFFYFYKSAPASIDCDWMSVSALRKMYPNPEDFDKGLFKNLTMVVDNPEDEYPNIKVAWTKFLSLFTQLRGLVFYKEVFDEFFMESLKEFNDDNVQFIELRALLVPVYDLDGNTYAEDWVLERYFNLSKAFTSKNPEDFFGTKIIFSDIRGFDKNVIEESIQKYIRLKDRFPDYLLGYDLVGPEESGHTLLYFINQLLRPSEHGANVQFFFHAGETAWSGTEIDKNLIDAVLLNTTRIGHGYAITKHPIVKKIAKERGIAVEVCPYSNQVLKLVHDIRNHPAAELLVEGFPVVISSDDPGLFGTKGLSYDWYATFMGIGGGWADLKMLKQLAMDSIKFSAASNVEKDQLYKLWGKKWDTFIDRVIVEYKL